MAIPCATISARQPDIRRQVVTKMEQGATLPGDSHFTGGRFESNKERFGHADRLVLLATRSPIPLIVDDVDESETKRG